MIEWVRGEGLYVDMTAYFSR